MKTKDYKVDELSQSEMNQIIGGGIVKEIGKAVGRAAAWLANSFDSMERGQASLAGTTRYGEW